MKVKMTAKRQATFPAELCRELGLQPGDTVDLEARIDDGRKIWVLKRAAGAARPWIGSLKNYARKNAEAAPIEPTRLPAAAPSVSSSFRRFTVFGNA